MTQNMSASSSVRCNMENFISRAPYGTPSNSEFNYEDTTGRSHQLCHGTVQHQRQVCISSQGSSCVRKFSQNTRRRSITNTKDLRTTRKIEPIFCQGQQRIVIKLPLLQLHQFIKTHIECSIVCVQKELTVIERAQYDYRSTLSETRVCRIPSYLDTGQKLEERTQSRMKNVETKSSLFSTKKTDLLIAVMHGSRMLWYVFVECQNAMITRLLSNAPLLNLVKLSILRALLVYTTADQLCGQQKLYTMISTQHGSDYAGAEQIIVFVVTVLVVDAGISRGSRKKEMCKFFKMGIYHYRSVCLNAHFAPATEQSQPGLSFAADSGLSFTIDPLKRINEPEFVFKFNEWQSPTGSVEVQQAEQKLPEERLVSLDLSEEGVVADDEAEEEGAIAAAGMPYAVVITMNNHRNGLGMTGIHVDSVLCPYFESRGVCMMDTCPYVAIYKRCDKFCLNVLDKEQQGLHDVECIKQHELDMQQSFTVHRSKDKICDIYLKVIMEKPCREQRFGILPNFSNIFFLKCIWTWRHAKHSKNNIKLGCRTCRIPSDFMCPSIVWVGSREEKDEPINDNITHCKHFKQDSSKCLFGNKCFYVLVDVGGPSRQTDNRLQISHLQDFFRKVLYQRDPLLIDFVLSILSDSDDSAMSELFDQNTYAESILRSYDAGEECVEYLYKAIETLTGYWDKLVRQLDIRDKYWIGKYEQSNGRVYSISCIFEEREVATTERKVLTRAIQCFPNKERYMDRVFEECSNRDPEVKKKKFGFKYHRSKENNIELIYPINAISVFNICTTGGSDDYGKALGGQAASRRLFGMKPTGNHRKRYVRNCDDDDNRRK
nr:uncharacterized protein LOC115266045 [Aedes albopictus]